MHLPSFYAKKKPENITDNICKLFIIFIPTSWRETQIQIQTVHMSQRVQKDYVQHYRQALKAENFAVEIDFSEPMPIAYVWLGQGEDNPSTAISVLWKHFKNSEDDNIRFQMIGPSPFHADFFVSRNDKTKFDIRIEERLGYDDVEITAPRNDEVGNIKKAVMFRLSKEVSLFYSVVRDSIVLDREFRKLTKAAESLTENAPLLRRTKEFDSRRG